jgi:hypothetical protein
MGLAGKAKAAKRNYPPVVRIRQSRQGKLSKATMYLAKVQAFAS